MSHFPHHHYRRDDDPVPDPLPGITEEQLVFFTDQTKRAADKALARYSKRALVGFALLFVGFLYNACNNSNQWERIEEQSRNGREAIVQSGRVVSVDGCNRAYEERVKIRDVFLTSRSIVKTRLEAGESADPKNDRRALVFYEAQLRAFSLPDCRESETLLTDDPNAPVPSVQPFYEGAPYAPKSIFDGPGSEIVPPVSSEGRKRP